MVRRANETALDNAFLGMLGHKSHGNPVDLIAREIYLEEKQKKLEAAAKQRPEDPAELEQKRRYFDPVAQPVGHAPGTVSKEAQGILKSVADAPDIKEALNLASTLPELGQLAAGGGGTIFQQIRRFLPEPWKHPAFGHYRNYANTAELVLEPGARTRFRMRVVRHDIAQSQRGMWRQDTKLFDKRYSGRLLAPGFMFSGTSDLAREMDQLTPKALASALGQLIKTGKPTAVFE